jgi:hypothetical protein
MCVGCPYKRFYLKYGAVETAVDSPWAIWHDVGALAGRLPRPSEELMTGLRMSCTSRLRGFWLRRWS